MESHEKFHGSSHHQPESIDMGVSENVVYPFLPNGFADHYPVFKWLFVWEYTIFSDKPIFLVSRCFKRFQWLPSLLKADSLKVASHRSGGQREAEGHRCAIMAI